jgi:hypothetical protein
VSHDAMRTAEITPEKNQQAPRAPKPDDARNADPIPSLPGQTRSLVLSLYALPMTRAQVARYLGRSIATVRRAEGRHLHPHRDAKGIFRFAPDEVRELRAALDRGQVRLARVDFESNVSKRDRVETLRLIAALQTELAELREGSRALLEMFYAACPAQFLSELDPELLESLDTITSPARQEEHDWSCHRGALASPRARRERQ